MTGVLHISEQGVAEMIERAPQSPRCSGCSIHALGVIGAEIARLIGLRRDDTDRRKCASTGRRYPQV